MKKIKIPKEFFKKLNCKIEFDWKEYRKLQKLNKEIYFIDFIKNFINEK